MDVLNGVGGPYTSGRTYTSTPRKLVGPLAEVSYPHLLDVERQNTAWTVLGELTGTVEAPSA